VQDPLERLGPFFDLHLFFKTKTRGGDTYDCCDLPSALQGFDAKRTVSHGWFEANSAQGAN